MGITDMKKASAMTVEGYKYVWGTTDCTDDGVETVNTTLSSLYDVQASQSASAATMADGLITAVKDQAVTANAGRFTVKAAGATGTTTVAWRAFGKE